VLRRTLRPVPTATTLASRTKAFVLDRWATLGHKEAMRNGHGTGPAVAATWVGEHRRRLTAYKVLAAYRENCAKEFLPAAATDAERADRREYGEPDLLVERVVAGVLGDQIEVAVDGADTELDDAPVLPAEPQAPADGAPETERIVFESRSRVWREEAAAAVERWERERAEVPGLAERQEWLRDWADDELLESKLWEGERDGAVSLGDGVYVVGLSRGAGRPTLDVHDPGFYFPVLTEDDRGYPTTVHLAWEYAEPDPARGAGATRQMVRRITYELAPIGPATELVDAGGRIARLPRLADDGSVVLADGDRYDAEGRIVRRYPWQSGDDPPSSTTCLMTDATWPLELIGDRTVENFDLGAATFRTNEDGEVCDRVDLRLDFVPVVHIPDTPSSKEHFGRSVLARVLQLLDDLQATDTDTQAAAGLAAGPVIGLSGEKAAPTKEGAEVKVAPGTVHNLGPNGRMDVLDLSGSVDALARLADHLLDRLFVNVQVPAELLGRVKGLEVSGIRLALGFGPFIQLIRVLRLVRDSKYRLLLKFVQRVAQSGGLLPPGPTPTARLVFGSFIPSDLTGTVELVVNLLRVHGISRRTALAMLVDGGLDIGDLAEELAALEGEDFDGAKALADATGEEALAADYLGLELPEPPPGPAPLPIVLPPGAGT
jgi:hypothetical protein